MAKKVRVSDMVSKRKKNHVIMMDESVKMSESEMSKVTDVILKELSKKPQWKGYIQGFDDGHKIDQKELLEMTKKFFWNCGVKHVEVQVEIRSILERDNSYISGINTSISCTPRDIEKKKIVVRMEGLL